MQLVLRERRNLAKFREAACWPWRFTRYSRYENNSDGGLGAVGFASGGRRREQHAHRSGPRYCLRGHSGSRSLIGIEGGVGFGPERLNVGLEHRDGKLFGYVEADPWLILGGSLGVGLDSDRVISPILGVWEGLEIRGPGCDSGKTGAMVTVAAGYRFAGVHELYITVKAGRGRDICIPRE